MVLAGDQVQGGDGLPGGDGGGLAESRQRRGPLCGGHHGCGVGGTVGAEATGADIEAMGIERGHRTLVVTRKRGKIVTIPLAPRTSNTPSAVRRCW